MKQRSEPAQDTPAYGSRRTARSLFYVTNGSAHRLAGNTAYYGTATPRRLHTATQDTSNPCTNKNQCRHAITGCISVSWQEPFGSISSKTTIPSEYKKTNQLFIWSLNACKNYVVITFHVCCRFHVHDHRVAFRSVQAPREFRVRRRIDRPSSRRRIPHHHD